ncbi:MAG TPA: hypothetical protein VLF16_06990 [Pseudomonas sp.]|nr:hypothetical protein [Pseudomonas sp.]
MKKDTIKCGWCGAMVELTKNRMRPRQHLNCGKTCVGSGQLVEQHNFVARLKFNQMVK